MVYVVYVRWRNGGDEELDVIADSREEAIAKAKQELASDYEPGWQIEEILEAKDAPGFCFIAVTGD
jgi:hypothetical protein